MSEKMNVGGQAIIEGVMMRSPRSLAIAVRRPTGEIVVTERAWESIWERFKFLRWPFFRGTVVLLESLFNGIQALMFSANQAMIGEELKEKTSKAAAESNINPDIPATEHSPSSIETDDSATSKWYLVGTIIFSLGFAFALFKGIPHLLAFWAGLSTESIWFHVLDGTIKIVMFIGYVLLISRMKDIKRVFQYHGAEHKSIYAFENGEDLTVENAKKYTTLHPRCGTSFIIIVLLSSIMVFMVAFQFIPPLAENRFLNALLQIAIKLPLMLPIAGVSYEFLRWSSKHMDNPLVRWMVKPGLWLQLITTSEPDDDQLEVALVSLRKALWREQIGITSLDEAKGRIEIYKSAADIAF
jgi:uncharacterized protein YqhQ